MIWLLACTPAEPAVEPVVEAPPVEAPAAPIGDPSKLTMTGGGFTLTGTVPASWGEAKPAPWAADPEVSGWQVVARVETIQHVMVDIITWDAEFAPDAHLTVEAKQGAAALVEQVWTSRTIDGLIVRDDHGLDVLAPRGLIWRGIDRPYQIHASRYIETADGELRGIEMIATQAEEVAFIPHATVLLMRPSERVGVVVDLDLLESEDIRAILTSNASDGDDFVRNALATYEGELGGRLLELEAFVRTLKVTR